MPIDSIIVFQSSYFQTAITTKIACLNLNCIVILNIPRVLSDYKSGKFGGQTAALLVWWRMAEGAVQ